MELCKGGYEWETLRIPFHHFYQQYNDAKTRDQNTLPLDAITGFRFRIQDNVQGPFKLEIDYIASTYDWSYNTMTNQIYKVAYATITLYSYVSFFNYKSNCNVRF